MTARLLESDLQSDIIAMALALRWFAVKITSPSRRGMMDIYAVRDSQHIWIEVKRPGEPPRAQQERVASEMRAKGARVYTVDSIERAREILR